MVNNPVPQMPRKIKNLNKFELKELGLPENNVKIVDTVEQIKKNPPNIIVAECIRDIAFVQNRFKLQRMKKKIQYVMGLGIYAQLKYDDSRSLKILKPGKFKFKNVYKPYFGQDLTNKTILFERTGGIGDLLFLNPIFRHLKNKYPTCKIKMACGPQYQMMMETFENVDQVLDLPFPANILFEAHYHAIFEGIIERTIQAQKTNAYVLFSKSLGLDILEKDLIPIQTAKADRVEECKKTLEEWKILDKPFVLLQPRASSPIRTPRYSLWAKIINKIVNLGYKIIITDSPHQKERLDDFIKGLLCQDEVFNYAGISKSLDYTIAMASLIVVFPRRSTVPFIELLFMSPSCINVKSLNFSTTFFHLFLYHCFVCLDDDIFKAIGFLYELTSSFAFLFSFSDKYISFLLSSNIRFNLSLIT